MKIAIHYIYTIYVNIILLSTSKRLYMIHMNVFTAFLSRKYFLTAKKKCPQFGQFFHLHIREISLLFNFGRNNEVSFLHYLDIIYVNIFLLSKSKQLYIIHMKVFTAFLSRKYFLTTKKKMSPVWSIFSSKYSRNIIIVQCWSIK